MGIRDPRGLLKPVTISQEHNIKCFPINLVGIYLGLRDRLTRGGSTEATEPLVIRR